MFVFCKKNLFLAEVQKKNLSLADVPIFDPKSSVHELFLRHTLGRIGDQSRREVSCALAENAARYGTEVSPEPGYDKRRKFIFKLSQYRPIFVRVQYPSTVNGHSDLASDKDHLLKRLLTLPFEYFRQHDKALRNLFSTAKTPNYDDMLKHYGTAIRQTNLRFAGGPKLKGHTCGNGGGDILTYDSISTHKLVKGFLA